MTPKTKQLIEQFAQLYNGQGDPCDYGCSEESVEQMIVRAKELFPTKPCCVVSEWCWADVDIDVRQAEELQRTGVQACFIYSNKIIRDEADPWAEGSCVRTSFLEAFHDRCIFSTRNTNYVLVGSGVRMKVLPQVLTNLVFN